MVLFLKHSNLVIQLNRIDEKSPIIKSWVGLTGKNRFWGNTVRANYRYVILGFSQLQRYYYILSHLTSRKLKLKLRSKLTMTLKIFFRGKIPSHFFLVIVCVAHVFNSLQSRRKVKKSIILNILSKNLIH